MGFKLAADIALDRAPQSDEERFAVRQLKVALNRLGYYAPDSKTGITDDIDANLKDALYAYQRNATIFFDDVDLGPGSTTERILDEDLDYMDRDDLFSGAYVWRTVGDDKVRGEHAHRNGQTYLWSDPPEGGHPGEDYNCRCWAESLSQPDHHWPNWARERRAQRLTQSATVEKLAPPENLKVGIADLITPVPVDAINPAISPLDFIGWGAIPAAKIAGREIIDRIAAKQLAREAFRRDVDWIRNAATSKIQHMYKQADKFGVEGNWNPIKGEEFRIALEKHIKSADTKVIKDGSYHTKPATHYLNPKNNLNVIKNEAGNVEGAWRVSDEQKFHLLKNGKLGGGRK